MQHPALRVPRAPTILSLDRHGHASRKPSASSAPSELPVRPDLREPSEAPEHPDCRDTMEHTIVARERRDLLDPRETRDCPVSFFIVARSKLLLQDTPASLARLESPEARVSCAVDAPDPRELPDLPASRAAQARPARPDSQERMAQRVRRVPPDLQEAPECRVSHHVSVGLSFSCFDTLISAERGMCAPISGSRTHNVSC